MASPRTVDEAAISAFTRHHRRRATVAGYLATARRLIPELRALRSSAFAVPLLLVWATGAGCCSTGAPSGSSRRSPARGSS